MDFPNQIHRSSKPSMLDVAPYLQVCLVGSEIYIQISKDEDVPNWYHHNGTKEEAALLIENLKCL